jgi:GNAT superfamily N-acetyltransferase
MICYGIAAIFSSKLQGKTICCRMSHLLDNMIWNALSTGNRDIAMLNGNVGCYLPQVAPFAGVKEWNNENWEQLYHFIPPGRKIAVSCPENTKPEESKWKLLHQMPVSQMVYEKSIDSFVTESSLLIEPLTNEHVPQMLELTALTKPGPFFEKTILFGNYFGIFTDGRLAAMTGQRMNPVPYLEVSAVCTHPDFRGRGYAKTLMLHVMKIILDNSFIPFLHVLTNNIHAIHLYQTIGFRTRKNFSIDVIERLG